MQNPNSISIRAPSSSNQRSEANRSTADRDSSKQNGTNAVGHYILGKAVGEGTFGKVKLGTHVLTGEKVSKIITVI